MCNLYRIEKNPDAIRRLFAEVQIPLTFPEGIPNFEPRNVRISEKAPIVRFNADQGVAELIERRWSWPAPGGKPVFNMRSDGREFGRDRCLVIADGFYEFTTPEDPKQKRKDCWLFEPTEGELAIAGIIRSTPEVGEAFTMLTVPPGPDISPYHNRGVALLTPPQWRGWLEGSAKSVEALQPAVGGSLTVSKNA
ncbi:MAG TPA: SOS response-associated peptidase family protein [Sphingomicrobium sp.]|nr:SOS response-associated peptidase family protein [Sphingomicrobium sp.]